MEKIINNFDDYSINDYGVIHSYKNGKCKIMKLCPCTNKYLSVVLSKKGVSKRFLVHRLVAENFILNENNYSQVNHKDGIVTNNSVANLEWVTPKMNIQHALKNNLHKAAKGEFSGQSKLTDKIVLDLRRKYITGNYTTRQLSNELKMNHSSVWCAIVGKTWKHLKSIELLKQENL